MKRKAIIATLTAAVLVGGGTATAFGVAGSGSGDDAAQPAAGSAVRLADQDAEQDKAGGDHDDDCDDHGRHEHGRDSNDRREDTGAVEVSLREAVQAVHKARPGTITEIELDTERNRLVWEADVLGDNGRWHDVDIDASTGKVVHNRVDAYKDDDRSVARGARIDVAAAAAKAAEASKGTVTSADLERDGRWEIDAVDKQGNEHEIDIDARSGKVLHHETDQADHDDHDDHDGDDGSDD
ncbi:MULTISPECIES: PepSY domain-containing protein [Streptomyces]|uniref:Peptidase n=1 Tax=Streptomyces cacaoi TaxID=1898 RepID=A0A4Y3R9R2_STRCI|nr:MULTISPECIES: PepSY domain-containing protein [Streptomyces]NNG86767.1 peptidase M4 [Streptomyces cacaoi]QHF96905.1 peptidase M4 [Streptomyces sp. NHF165]GEB53578.1 peptidase [Streptomyces cacaoi]